MIKSSNIKSVILKFLKINAEWSSDAKKNKTKKRKRIYMWNCETRTSSNYTQRSNVKKTTSGHGEASSSVLSETTLESNYEALTSKGSALPLLKCVQK